MTATATSREAHAKLKTIGQLGRTERLVFEQIKYMESQAKDEKDIPSRRDVATMLGMETSSVSGRVKSLIDYGFVRELKDSGKKDPITGMTVGVLHIVDPNDIKLITEHKEAQHGDAVPWLADCYD